MGGVLFPLLSDWTPSGQVGRDYGVWLDEDGFHDRGTLLIDRDGTVLWSEVFECGFRIPTNLYRIASAL